MPEDENRISGVSLFEPWPKRALAIEKDFVPFDQSMVWQWNNVFWKHLDLWEQSYGEHFERALPSGISLSHQTKFINFSSRRFFELLKKLQTQNRLPGQIIILEQGPGSGEYAKHFLDRMRELSGTRYPFYRSMLYVLSDTSEHGLRQLEQELKTHSAHIYLHHQQTGSDLPEQFLGKALFVRHSNLWDQFPCRILQCQKSGFSEVLTKAMLDSDIKNDLEGIEDLPPLKEIIELLSKGKFEEIITSFPQAWKPLVNALRLKRKVVKLSDTEFNKIPYSETFGQIAPKLPLKHDVFISSGVLENFRTLMEFVDWERSGYMEIVDLLVRRPDGFTVPRVPKIFDGAIAMLSNGPQIKEFARSQQKRVHLKGLRKANTKVTVRNHDLKTLLEGGEFITMTEIAAKEGDTSKKILEKAQEILEMNIDVLAFSDQAHAWKEFLPIQDHIANEIFPPLHGPAVLPVFAARRKKDQQEIALLTKQLKEQGIRNLFVVTGDPPIDNPDEVPHLTSLDLLPQLSQDFFTGAVALPQADAIPRTLKKVEAGAKFLIVQSTYDFEAFAEWIDAVKKTGLHEKAYIIPSLVPILTKRSIEAISALPDVPISKNILSTFEHCKDKDQFRAKGMELAKEMIHEYQEAGIFAGVYVFAKSIKVAEELLRPYT